MTSLLMANSSEKNINYFGDMTSIIMRPFFRAPRCLGRWIVEEVYRDPSKRSFEIYYEHEMHI
jgi:hypothetical protein